MMKKLFIALISASMLFGCSSKPKSINMTLNEVTSKIEEIIAVDRPMMMVSGMETLSLFAPNISELVVDGRMISGTIIDATRAVIVEVTPGSDTSQVEAELQQILERDQDTFSWYQTESNTFVNDGKVVVVGQFVILYIAENHQEVAAMLKTLK